MVIDLRKIDRGNNLQTRTLLPKHFCVAKYVYPKIQFHVPATTGDFVIPGKSWDLPDTAGATGDDLLGRLSRAAAMMGTVSIWKSGHEYVRVSFLTTTWGSPEIAEPCSRCGERSSGAWTVDMKL